MICPKSNANRTRQATTIRNDNRLSFLRELSFIYTLLSSCRQQFHLARKKVSIEGTVALSPMYPVMAKLPSSIGLSVTSSMTIEATKLIPLQTQRPQKYHIIRGSQSRGSYLGIMDGPPRRVLFYSLASKKILRARQQRNPTEMMSPLRERTQRISMSLQPTPTPLPILVVLASWITKKKMMLQRISMMRMHTKMMLNTFTLSFLLRLAYTSYSLLLHLSCMRARQLRTARKRVSMERRRLAIQAARSQQPRQSRKCTQHSSCTIS